MGFVNIVNTNTSFNPMKKLSHSYAHMLMTAPLVFENPPFNGHKQ